MSLLPNLNFAGGEIDPILYDKQNLDKVRNGLATARNITVTKTGGILSRFSTYHLAASKNAGEKIKLYVPENSGNLVEWGHQYVRVYSYDISGVEAPVNQYLLPYLTIRNTLTHALTEDDLENIHFTTTGEYVYIFCSGKLTLKLDIDPSQVRAGPAFIPAADIFKIPVAPASINITQTGTSTGIPLQYMAVAVVNGEESLPIASLTGYPTPVAAPQTNLIKVKFPNNGQYPWVNEIRIYARPIGGGAFGLLGSTTTWQLVDTNTNYEYSFMDFGYAADYNNGEQALITSYGLNNSTVPNLMAKTGIVYQGRLLKVPSTNDEAIVASRPGYLNNFYRDFPYAADSALLFKAARSGRAKILRMLDHEGLIVFTTNGVYTSGGILSVDNLALTKRGKWVIDVKIPPLVVPGGVFFVDKANTIRQLIYNDQLLGYESVEQTIFSNHIFKDRLIKTWAFQDGGIPMILVTFHDGTFGMFTYNFEHKIASWSRGDSRYSIEQFAGTEDNDITFSVVNKDGQRFIEVLMPRKTSISERVLNSESKLMVSKAFMDGIKSYNGLMNAILLPDDAFEIDPMTPDVWDGPLNISNTAGIDFNNLVVGDVLKWFNPEDFSAIELEILSFPNAPAKTEFIVQPSEEFPSIYNETARLYLAKNVLTGFTHLANEKVSIIADGALVSSPNNDVDGIGTVTVAADGTVTLPGGLVGAIVHVGRPIVADIKTLPATTVEQSPTTLESMTANKLYVNVEDTRGLFIANKFPEEADGEVDGSSVLGMEAVDEELIPKDDVLTVTTYLEPISKRSERVLGGTWDNQGSIAIRQVDPLHFEITSIISDLEILTRSNRT